MATLVKDTHGLISFLQAKGYSKEQAEGFVEAVKEFDLESLATKQQQEVLNAKINMVLGMNTAILAGIIILLLDKLVG